VNKVEWWKSLNDPVLDSLIEEAFRQNPTLQAASLRVVQARIGRSAAGYTLYPLIMAQGSATHAEFSQTMKPDVDVTVSDRLQQILALPILNRREREKLLDVKMTPKLDVYSAGFDAIWELDLWGEKRRLIESKNANLQAAYAGYDDVMVSLAGEVAINYVQIRVITERLDVLRQNVKMMKDFQAVTEKRYANKESSETDVQLARTLVAIIEAGEPKLQTAQRSAENALCLLVGKMPQDLHSQLFAGSSFPTLPPQMAVGIPADLLRRRPDVRRAEYLAHAQCARIGQAKASIFPSLSLFGSLGLQSSDSGKLFDSQSKTSAYGGLLKATGLVNYPITIQRVRLEDAQLQEALLAYESAVLNAAREVEDAMTGHLNAKKEQAILLDGSKAAARSAQLAVGAYEQGKVIVSVPLVALTFQANLQDQVIAAQGDSIVKAIAMYKALGGGWQSRESQELVPEHIREEMKNRTDWWTFTGKKDLRTARQIVPPVEP
jgi:NodT family efflux transporter outer membrane factor (OMF) lipoprotein